MKIVGYIRVSTDRQAERGLGLEVQEQAIRRWARERRHRLAAVYRDEGTSGSNGLDDRVGLAEALDSIRRREAGGLAVYRLDRLARDLVLQEQILAEVRAMGAETFSTDGGEQGFLKDDPDEPSRRLIRQVLGAVAEYERAMINLRLRLGRRRKFERGGFAYGSPRYGWRSRDGELVPDQGEQAAMDLARRLRKQGQSLRAIGKELGIRGHRTRRGGPWHPVTVKRILARN
jgi:DNA invertase Pin-like site-specific DNA recombinase